MEFLYIEGKRAVEEAIKAGAKINYIMLADGLHLGNIVALAKEHRIRTKMVSRTKMDYTSKTKKHQGVIAVLSAFDYSDIDDMLDKAKTNNEKPFLIIADQITDPHNLGAIIRSAECFGAHGLILPKNRSAEVNETVYRSSSGAASRVKIARVTNLTNEISRLKQKGIWIIGADMEGSSLEETDFDLPLAPRGTPFQLKVWQALTTIPYGETRSYKQIAEQIGNSKACRAVGLANNRNPISIVVPCHRVIGANGKLVGYGGGLDVKKYLLELEGCIKQ